MFSAGVLARTGSPAAIPHLVSLLDHEDINVVQQVIDGLSQIRSTLAVDALVKVLDRDPWLRFAAVHALGEIGDQRAVSALAPLVDDESVRGAVIRAMGKIGSAEALAFLFRVVRESQDTPTFAECLRAIGEALEFQPNQEALQNITDWTELASPVVGRAARTSRAGAGLGVQRPTREGPDTRQSAAMIVKALKLRPLYTALVLAGRDPALREVLEFSAVSIGEEIVPVLRDGMTSPNAAVRMLACECLGALGHLPAAPLIESMLADPIKEVRAAAVNALMRLGCDSAIPAMRAVPDRSRGDGARGGGRCVLPHGRGHRRAHAARAGRRSRVSAAHRPDDRPREPARRLPRLHPGLPVGPLARRPARRGRGAVAPADRRSGRNARAAAARRRRRGAPLGREHPGRPAQQARQAAADQSGRDRRARRSSIRCRRWASWATPPSFRS